ncbi:MAG: hypothetical protein IE916_00345 [Epsilonproteobacteria bacterium]|nr:hypothetical protein [Campylobacterota bacterium]
MLEKLVEFLPSSSSGHNSVSEAILGGLTIFLSALSEQEQKEILSRLDDSISSFIKFTEVKELESVQTINPHMKYIVGTQYKYNTPQAKSELKSGLEEIIKEKKGLWKETQIPIKTTTITQTEEVVVESDTQESTVYETEESETQSLVIIGASQQSSETEEEPRQVGEIYLNEESSGVGVESSSHNTESIIDLFGDNKHEEEDEDEDEDEDESDSIVAFGRMVEESEQEGNLNRVLEGQHDS